MWIMLIRADPFREQAKPRRNGGDASHEAVAIGAS
jgi:hypothetical protein